MMMICFFITHSAFADVTADFTADQTTIVAGTEIQFTDLSIGNPTSWQWDFQNDGTIDSYDQNPAWTYEEPGLFTVSLTVSDGTTSDTETKTDYIDVRVNIPDANFKARINVYLGQPPDYNPTVEDLNGITGNFFAGNLNISSIEGAQYLTNLTLLYLLENHISDISAVSGLTNLTSLSLNSNQISDISALSGLTNLTLLSLYINQISDISTLSGLTNLKWLYLHDNQISDISAFSGLTNLRLLYLYSNQISDIYPLVENTGLGSGDVLQLHSNPLSLEALIVHIPILESRGFAIFEYPSTPNNYAACYPDPARYETGVDINADLEWQGNFPSRDAVYNVWLGETSDNLLNVGYGTAINDTLYSFTPILNPDTDYWWKIGAITATASDTLWSGLWYFTTYIIADFSVDQTTIVAGTEIQFTDLSTGNPTNWQWDFENDGTIDSYEQNPTWTYEEHGLFTVSLTVSDGTTSDTEIKTDYIDVRVYIPDENFKTVINGYLGQPPAYNPSVADLNGLTGTFDAENSNISSIEGSQYLTNLTELDLGWNQINDISALSGLTNLTELKLHSNQISDISTISGLVNLAELGLSYNQINNISALSGLSNLTELGLANNQINDISPISGLVNLAELGLSYNQISNIFTLSGLSNLTELGLANNQISDISPISGLVNLAELDLSYNQISNISALSGLTNLTKLYLNKNQISDISALSSLTILNYLKLYENQISDISPISGLTSLSILYLNENQFSDIYHLVENLGLGSGDILHLFSNPLSREALNVHIPILESRGFDTLQFPSTPNNYAACYPDPARYEAVDYINADLEWQGNFPSRDAVYDVWLGETSDDLVNVGFSTAINDTLYSFTPALNPDTDYWWKVRAITSTDTIWSGLWHFTTYIIADFSAGQTSIEEGDTIQFTDLSIGNPTNWEWDFENNGTIDSYEQNPEWIYIEAGTYSVSLTVSNGIYTDTKLKEKYIIVYEPQTPHLVSLTPGIEEITLEWETISNKSNEDNKTGHFIFEGGGMSPEWTIYIGGAAFNGTDMEAGDEIGVFDGDLLVGVFSLIQVCTPANQFENEMPTHAYLVSGPGFQPGNVFTMVAWDESAQVESTSFEYTFSDPYGDAWTGDVFPDGDGQYSMAEFTFTCYIPTFNIYYEDGTLVAGEVEGTTFTDFDLIAGQEYCYYVTQILESGEESNPSNVLCATPLFDNAPILISATPGIEEIDLEWEPISNKTSKDNKTGHFNFEGPESPWTIWTIYISAATFNGIDMEPGDEIGIFDGEFLVGDFTIGQICTPENQFYNDLLAYAYVGYFNNDTVYNPGNTFTLVAWDESAQIESTSFEYTFSDPYGDAWTGNVFPYEENEYSMAEFSFSYSYVPTFNVYYEDGTLVAGEVEGATFTDFDLIAGQEYCYYVTQILESGEESNPSNVECGTTEYPVGAPEITGIEKSGPKELTISYLPMPNSKTEHFDFEGGVPSSPFWTIYVGSATFNVEDMEAGDEIGIFDGDLLVGAFTLDQICTPDNQFDNELLAFSVLVSGPGYTSGNDFTLIAWDESLSVESMACNYTFSNPYGDAWENDYFPSDDGEYSMVELDFYGSMDVLFNLYYADGTLVASQIPGPYYTDTDLTPGQEYCYYIKQILYGGGESDKSNVECEIAGYPIISTDPEYFHIEIEQYIIITDYLNIINNGSINLDWSAVVEYYAASDWVTITPDSGTVVPDDLQEVELMFDATDFNPEEQYFAEILISSNDPYTPILTIPIQMVVFPGIDEWETVSLIVYPNPSTGIFNISLKGVIGDIQIEVLDLRGKEYSNFELEEVTSTKLDLTDLPAGIYFISLSGKDFKHVKKIIIQ